MSNVIPIATADDSPFHVGDRIRKVRELCGYEHERVEFARIVHTDRGTLGKYEAGRQAPKIATLHTIASVTGARFEFLAHGKGPVFEKTGPTVHPLGLEPRTHWIRDNVTSIGYAHDDAAPAPRILHPRPARHLRVVR